MWMEWQNENKRTKQMKATLQLGAITHTKCDYERNEEITNKNA